MSRPSELHDVAVIGGGVAGLSAALMLSRVRRSVIVIDSGSPRNAPSDSLHGLLGHEGIHPADLLERGRAEVRRHGGTVIAGEVVAARPLNAECGADLTFGVDLADGTRLRARRVLVATGVRDRLPEVGGLEEHWGRGVVHCPFCHGWEVRDRPIAVIATSPFSCRQALMFRSLTDDLMVLTDGRLEVDDDQRDRFAAVGIDLIEAGAREVVTAENGELSGVRLLDGHVVSREVLVVVTTMTARLEGLQGLQLPVEELPGGMGSKVATAANGATEVPGVWAAGNAADPSAQVGMAAAAGARAGGHIAWSLANAEGAAVPRTRG